MRGAIALFIGCAGFASPAVRAGPEILLYPLARAFGSPSEAELAQCREAFRKLQAELPTNPVLVAPVLVRPLGAKTPALNWRADLAQELAERISASGIARLSAIAEAPAVTAPEMGHNQMRYAWRRAVHYADAVKKAAPRAEHVLFTEVWTAKGQVAAIHFFVLNPAGQIAFCRWFNSHQFGKELSFENGAWIEFATRHMLRDLARPPEKLFPPYGIG